MTGSGYMSSQTKQISKVNNANAELLNGLDLKIIERVRNLQADEAPIITSSG